MSHFDEASKIGFPLNYTVVEKNKDYINTNYNNNLNVNFNNSKINLVKDTDSINFDMESMNQDINALRFLTKNTNDNLIVIAENVEINLDDSRKEDSYLQKHNNNNNDYDDTIIYANGNKDSLGLDDYIVGR
jgi:hypothetical protein